MDIVEQADASMCRENVGCKPDVCVCGVMGDMKDEIERLRKDKAELLEDIKKLKEAKEINNYNSYPDDGFGGYPSVYNRR